MVIGIKNKEDFEEELKTRFPNSNIEILTYTKASGPISYRCLDCGKIYNKTRANHLYENKTLCSYCFSGRTSKVRDLVYNKIAKDFEIIKWNGNSGVAITFKCLSCGYIFQKHPGNIDEDYDKNTFCPQCGINGSLVSQDIYQYRMKQKGLDEYKIITYKNYKPSEDLIKETIQVNEMVEMIDCVGMNVYEALSELEKIGLQVEVQGEGDYVCSQFPAPNSEVVKNGIVMIDTNN